MINSVGLVEVNGTKLYYEAKGTGATVVLLHNGLLDSRVWDEQIETFARHHTVVRYDRPPIPCLKLYRSERKTVAKGLRGGPMSVLL